MQKLFSHYLGNKIVPATAANIPVQNRPLTKKDSSDGVTSKTIPALFYSATLNHTSGIVYVKLVNTMAKKQIINIKVNGITKNFAEAKLIVVKGDQPCDTNTLGNPEKIPPQTSVIKNIKPLFARILEPYSVTIIELKPGN